jgi:hypothetical protein
LDFLQNFSNFSQNFSNFWEFSIFE